MTLICLGRIFEILWVLLQIKQKIEMNEFKIKECAKLLCFLIKSFIILMSIFFHPGISDSCHPTEILHKILRNMFI